MLITGARIAVMAVTVILLAGCTTLAGSKGPPDWAGPNASYQTRAVLGTCVSVRPDMAVGTALASALVAKGVNRIGAAVKAAAASDTRQVIVRQNIELNKDGLGPCLLVARGWFYPTKALQDNHPYQSTAGSTFNFDSAADSTRLRNAGLWLAGTPDFYFEGQFRESTDKTALSLVPEYAYMGQPIATHSLRPGTARSVLLAFAITKPQKAADLSKGQGSTVVIGRLAENLDKTFESDELLPNECSPPACDPAELRLKIRDPLESEWFTVPLTGKAQPMTLQVLVSETRSESKFLGFVADVFGAVESDLTKELQAALIPSVADAAAETEAIAAENAATEYEAAFADALAKLAACSGDGDDLAKASAAKAAMRKANQKARANSQDEPFAKALIDAIKIEIGEDSTAACDAAGNP
jgi:hypothetical protein